MDVHVTVVDSPNWTDITSALGQALGAIFTLVAVIVALAIAIRDGRHRANEERARAEAQARLVVVGQPEFTPGVRSDNSNAVVRDFLLSFTNFSDKPILNVRFQAWTTTSPSQTVDGAPHFETTSRIMLPGGQAEKFKVSVGALSLVMAWRLRWTDPEGFTWFVSGGNADPKILHPSDKIPPRSDIWANTQEK